MKSRHFWVLVHRYAGLTMAGFLIIVGLTGSLLAFFTELEQLINPHWYPVHVTTKDGDGNGSKMGGGSATIGRESKQSQEKILDAATLAERLERREPRLQASQIELESFYGGGSAAWVTSPNQPYNGRTLRARL